jgi:hypothetical protein
VWPAQDERWHADGYDAGWAARTCGEGWRETAGIRDGVRFHDLRHTCASHLVQGTWAPSLLSRALRLEEVREWLGHTSIKVTERYAHLCADGIRSLVRAPDLDTIGTRPEAAARIRTGDLRFTKPRSLREIVGGKGADPAPCPVACPDPLRELAVRYLRALAEGDPLRDRLGAELGAAVLDQREALEPPGAAGGTRDHGESRRTEDGGRR